MYLHILNFKNYTYFHIYIYVRVVSVYLTVWYLDNNSPYKTSFTILIISSTLVIISSRKQCPRLVF